MAEEKQEDEKISRRDFIKISSLIGATFGVVGAGAAGFASGEDKASYTGFERAKFGGGQFVDRKSLEVDKPTYEKVGETSRIRWVPDHLIGRHMMMGALMKQGKWSPDMGVDALPEPLKTWYTENPGDWQNYLGNLKAAKLQAERWEAGNKETRGLVNAWRKGHDSTLRGYPGTPDTPPEVWDFRGMRDKPLKFKSELHAATLIKAVAYNYDATLGNITKLNPDWVWKGRIRGDENPAAREEVPAHWEYAIVIGIPMEWDATYANPLYGTSKDAYSRLRIAGGKLAHFIRELGYPARAHVPGIDYELSCPPIAIDAGMGEQGRNGICITPETGANIRLCVVTTNLKMQVDKPIDFGVQDFCKDCKICAEQCPSGAISMEDEPTVVRGYKRWLIDDEACKRIWSTVSNNGSQGCRICVAVCPYSRKHNWLHDASRSLSSADPTGLVDKTLHWMSKNWYDYPEAADYLPPPDGMDATFRPPPDWLDTDTWFDISD